MASKYKLQLRSVSSVASSKTTVIDIPVGGRCHYVVLQAGYAAGTNTIAGAATHLSEIRVKVNGRVQRTMSGTQLRDMNLLNGTAYDCTGLPNTAPGVSFPIYFAEPWRKDARDQDSLAWQTKGWQSFQIEVDIGAVGTQTAASQTLVAYAVFDNVQSDGIGICKWIRQSFAAAGTAFDIATLDRRDWLTQISLYADSGASLFASKTTLRLSGQIVHEMSQTANVALNTNMAMTPAASGRTASITDIVLDHDDLLGSALNLNGTNDLSLTVEAASAMSGTITAIVQRIGPPE